MNDDPGTTVGQTAPPRGRGRPPKVKETESYIALQEKGQRSNFKPGTGRGQDEQPLKISEMPISEPQNTADNEKDNLINELKETLTPFAKLPCEQDAPPEKILYKICRGSIEADITNGNIIKAKTVLGIM